MNARIQELALEAFDPINALASEGVADRHTFDQAWFQLYNKKFAELIVQECISVIDSLANSDDSDDYFWTVRLTSSKLKEHFGVTE